MSLKMSSDAFSPGQTISRKYTVDGENISPPLSWRGLPAQSRELVLIMEDPDAPQPEPFVHWVMYKIPPEATNLPEGVPPESRPEQPQGAVQGKNSFRKVGYGGPAPPPGHGLHHYHFRLYALDQPLEVKGGLDKKALLSAMSGHILDEADLVGTYQR